VEDEGFVDDDFIAETARDFVARYGDDARRVLQERAVIAEAAGDYLLAQTWRQIVEAAERMIGRGEGR
jgi:hypothetical protein